jgi:hypothetical protein
MEVTASTLYLLSEWLLVLFYLLIYYIRILPMLDVDCICLSCSLDVLSQISVLSYLPFLLAYLFVSRKPSKITNLYLGETSGASKTCL